MRIRIGFAVIILTSGLLAGCGTIATKAQGSWGKKYSGAQCSAAVTYLTANPMVDSRKSWVLVPFAAIDTVLSAIVDTAVLPIDFIVGKPKVPKVDCISLPL